MKISIFIKTFLILLISFSVVFLFSMKSAENRFGPLYIEENINAVKDSIQNESQKLKDGASLEDTELRNLSSETSFIRYHNGVVTEKIGPDFIKDEEIINYVIEMDMNGSVITEGNIMYYQVIEDDIYIINYVYTFEFGDWLIISTRIQSLQNVELVLNNINTRQSIYVFITITLLSLIISKSISRPLRKINDYAKDISNLDFETELKIRRNDEFKELASSLNEMTFNLKKSYNLLSEANLKLGNDIEFEKQQEEKKKKLIYTINHELKTPLSVMKGMVEGMIDGVGRYQDKDTYLKQLVQQIEKIEKITSDLTYSMRLEDKMKLGDSSSTKVLKQTFTDLKEFAKQQEKNLKINIKSSELLINEELLQIMVRNIIKNAILYTTSVDVFVSSESNIDDYFLIIKNYGHIKDEDLTKVFDSFYRSDSLHLNHDGNGLGLSIVKHICDLYGYECKLFNDGDYVITKLRVKRKL